MTDIESELIAVGEPPRNVTLGELAETVKNAALVLLKKELDEIARLKTLIGDPTSETPANAYWRARDQMRRAEIVRLRDEVRRLREELAGSEAAHDAAKECSG